MSADGAHQGVSAGRAIETILGGEPAPSDDEQMSPEEFRDWLLGPDEPMDYEAAGMAAYTEAARRAARSILLWFLEDPRRAAAGDPYDAMKAGGANPDDVLGLSGFQWGWALNAARRCVELGPLPNPAIIDIEVTK